MQEEIKNKPIILNGFTCTSPEQEEGDKNLVKRGNEIVRFFLTSFLEKYLVLACCSFLISLILCLNAFWSSLFNSPVSRWCVSSCLRLACKDGLPRIRHGAGIYQATELGNLDKSDMCEHASVSVWFLCLFLHFRAFSLFIPTQFSFPLLFSRKSCGPQESLAGWTAAQKHLGQLRSFMCDPSFARSKKQHWPHMQLLSWGSIYLCLASRVAFQ